MESVLKRMAVSGCLSDEENKIGERPGRAFLSGCSPRVLRGNGVDINDQKTILAYECLAKTGLSNYYVWIGHRYANAIYSFKEKQASGGQ